MDGMKRKVPLLSLTEENLQELESTLSSDRLVKYLEKTNENRQDAIHLYVWNTSISAAFYGPLQALEINLRNRINIQLSEKHGTEWIDISKSNINFFHPDHVKRLQEAKEILKQKKSIITPSDIVARLSFGFWVLLLAGHHEEKLWRPTLRNVFPHIDSRRKARQILTKMKNLRNRIAHHEPIFNLRLDNHYHLILEIIGYISPKQKEFVEAYSRVEEIISQKPSDPDICF